jgi:hypothetical protein
MEIYPTPEDKRRMGERVLTFDVRAGMDWLEAAAAQEAGTTAEYKAALQAWKASKPRARDFVPADVRQELEDREAKELARARAEFEALTS